MLRQGWTADDYEVGGKGKAAGLAENESLISMGVVRLETKSLNAEEEGKDARKKTEEEGGGGAAAKAVGQGKGEKKTAQGKGPPTFPPKASVEAETVRKMTNHHVGSIDRSTRHGRSVGVR